MPVAGPRGRRCQGNVYMTSLDLWLLGHPRHVLPQHSVSYNDPAFNDRLVYDDERSGDCQLYWTVTIQAQTLVMAEWRAVRRMRKVQSPIVVYLTTSTPAVPKCCCWKGSAPYWSNPPFLIFDIRALWRAVLSARVPECQKLKMICLTSITKFKALTGSAVKGLTCAEKPEA